MARKNSGRRPPIAGPKRTETVNPGQVNATFQAPGTDAPAAPKKQVTKTDLGLSEFSRTLAAGKSVGDYETRGAKYDFGGDVGEAEVPTAISKNTAHIEALHAMANEANDRITGIAKDDYDSQVKKDMEREADGKKAKGNYAKSATMLAVGPAALSLKKAQESFHNAHLAHLNGDAISSTIHVKEGAQHLVNAVNHLESGEVWGKTNEKGNHTSSFRSWRKDEKDFTPLVSISGAFHSKVAAAVNGYTQHVMQVADKKPEIASQLDSADLSPVSYTPADSDTQSPLIKRLSRPAKELTPEEQTLQAARAIAIKNTSDRAAKAAGTVKKPKKEPAYNTFAGVYENAKKTYAARIGKPDAKGNIYTQEQFDEEFAPIDKEERPEGLVTKPPVTPRTRPARNRGYKGSEEPVILEGQEDSSEAPATTKNVFDTQIAAHMGGGAGYDNEVDEETRKHVESLGGMFISHKDEDSEPEEDTTPVELPDEDTSEELSKKAATRAPRKRAVVEPKPVEPVKEARYDVFHAARMGGN
jgi:hypothetical protein